MQFLKLFGLFMIFSIFGRSQSQIATAAVSTDIRRVKIHEDINQLQKLIQSSIHHDVDSIQIWLESDESYDHRLKIKYLSGIKLILDDLKSGSVPANQAQSIIEVYKGFILLDKNGLSIETEVEKLSYEINKSLLSEKTVFYENPGLRKARLFLQGQFLKKYPEKILSNVINDLDAPFVDEVLTIAAHRFPSEFYNYASAFESPLRNRMLAVNDRLVQLLCRLSADSSGRLLYPFIHCIMSNEISYDSLKRITGDEKLFFHQLVNTQIHYQSEIEKGNPPLAFQEIFKLIKRKGAETFINEVNALHDETDAIRFKIIDGLSAEELYYLMIGTEDIIYTSSFVGLFQRMMLVLNKRSTDQLLINVHFDGFRKFIKMAADYNKLNDFIKAMRPEQAELLIKDFVAGLEHDATLENAVDVANGFSSINDVYLKKKLTLEVDSNLSVMRSLQNKFGIKVYETLQLLLMAEKDSGIAFSKKYGLGVQYFMPRKKLLHEERMTELLFFYGDKDGKVSFENFLLYYKKNKNWKIIRSEKWIEIKSIQKQPISIFANIPFDNTDGNDADAEAQVALLNYLNEKNLQPSIVVHRGHSYHLPSTIAQMPMTANVVILGSCGSYQHLSKVLDICPQAQIISSREVGSLSVNDPILQVINENIRLGKDLDWTAIWKKLNVQLGGTTVKSRFENYVAPHKNLGSLFLQAMDSANFTN